MKVTITCPNGHDATVEQRGSSIFADCPECEAWEEYRLVDEATEGLAAIDAEEEVADRLAADAYTALEKSRNAWRENAERLLEEMRQDTQGNCEECGGPQVHTTLCPKCNPDRCSTCGGDGSVRE